MTNIVIAAGLTVYLSFLGILFINSFSAFGLPAAIIEILHLVFSTRHPWMAKLKIAAVIFTANTLIALACTALFYLAGESAWKGFEAKHSTLLGFSTETVGGVCGIIVISGFSLLLYLRLIPRVP